ncbi:MAG: class I SAM-dependent methyltransferase [Bacteroidetes bacterium]|nr:class I SAM-dependent methyltransferase [Bacteroidota bacterium]
MSSSENTHQLIYLSDPKEFKHLNELYIKVRGKEKRLLSDAVVAKLPFIKKQDSVYFKEWKARSYSFSRLNNYLQKKEKPLHILDLGCGNGWLAANLATTKIFTVTGLDVNEEELQQANRVFQKPNLTYCFGDIFKNIFPEKTFDIIVLNACVQYFGDLSILIGQLFYYLKSGGEIHIIDTPFYTSEEIEFAKKRSLNYYSSLGFPEMTEQYYHHQLNDLSKFNYTILRKSNFLTQIKSKINGDVPANFAWIRITN